MKKKQKGFTLIEVLSVIVIIGLVITISTMNIAKYIKQSRLKTLVTTINSYTEEVTLQVNNRKYNFRQDNVIYALPIECVKLSKNGKNPFGEWYQATDNYWGYVLVQYDKEKLTHTYGFTFKDSGGYGMHPLTVNKISNSGEQIQSDFKFKKPNSGLTTLMEDKNIWESSGFKIDENTRIKVLRAETEGIDGDKKNTCTLEQRGSNYKEVEEEKNKPENLPMLMKADNTKAFWQDKYKFFIKKVTFENIIAIPSDAYESWDVTEGQNGLVMAYITKNKEDSNFYDLYIQSDEKIYSNVDSSYLFSNFTNLDKIVNINMLDTSKTTKMNFMFHEAGMNSKIFTLDLGENFDTSNVTNMTGMFSYTGQNNSNFAVNLGEKFDTSKVIDMNKMFEGFGYNVTNLTLDLNSLNTKNVINMRDMFKNVGYNSSKINLIWGDNFKTSKVTVMAGMFEGFGYKTENLTLDLSGFNTSQVTNMASMFNSLGQFSSSINLIFGNNFDTSNVTTMSFMFYLVGANSTNFNLDISSFNTKNVNTMQSMFMGTGQNNPNFTFNFGNNFDTNSVTNMSGMFSGFAGQVSNLTLDLSNFNTTNVTNMSMMFRSLGVGSKTLDLILGDGFDTSKVTNMSEMFNSCGMHAQDLTLDLSSFNTANVTDMSMMFNGAGSHASSYILYLGNNFDTSKVTNMEAMFTSAGQRADNFILNLGDKFDTTNVTNMKGMFKKMGKSNSKLEMGNKFNISNVTNMDEMFYGSKLKDIYLNKSNLNSSVSVTDMFKEININTNVYVKSESDKALLESTKDNSYVTIIVKDS